MIRGHPVCAALLILVLARVNPIQAQTTNPPYLSQFPTVEQVIQAMQVADPSGKRLEEDGSALAAPGSDQGPLGAR
jgi:hypothetical protein